MFQAAFDIIEAVGDSMPRYACKICGKIFTQPGNALRHKESIHDKVRFFCSLCGKSYCQKGHLAGHIKAVHGVLS